MPPCVNAPTHHAACQREGYTTVEEAPTSVEETAVLGIVGNAMPASVAVPTPPHVIHMQRPCWTVLEAVVGQDGQAGPGALRAPKEVHRRRGKCGTRGKLAC